MNFLRLQDDSEIEIAGYVKNYIKENRYTPMQIYVGCDSINKADKTVYVTTVVIHIGNSGCHVLYDRIERAAD